MRPTKGRARVHPPLGAVRLARRASESDRACRLDCEAVMRLLQRGRSATASFLGSATPGRQSAHLRRARSRRLARAFAGLLGELLVEMVDGVVGKRRDLAQMLAAR